MVDVLAQETYSMEWLGYPKPRSPVFCGFVEHDDSVGKGIAPLPTQFILTTTQWKKRTRRWTLFLSSVRSPAQTAATDEACRKRIGHTASQAATDMHLPVV